MVSARKNDIMYLNFNQKYELTMHIQNYSYLWIFVKVIIILSRRWIENGVPYFVGGIVRDAFLDLPSNDIDFEVFNMPYFETKGLREAT